MKSKTIRSKNKMSRQIVSLRLAMSYLMQRLGLFMENVGHLFFHLTTYGRRGGYIEFDVPEEEADGVVRHTVVDEYRKWHLQETTFRVSNRWLMRDRKKMPATLLWKIKTDAQIAAGLTVHSVVFGTYAFNRLEVKPFNMTKVPAPQELETNHTSSLFEDIICWAVETVEGWFPNRRDETPSMTLEDAARAIIIRNP